MRYELWGLHPGNLIATTRTEAEALRLVREMLKDGWSAEDLALGQLPDSEVEPSRRPPALQGSALAEKACQHAQA